MGTKRFKNYFLGAEYAFSIGEKEIGKSLREDMMREYPLLERITRIPGVRNLLEFFYMC